MKTSRRAIIVLAFISIFFLMAGFAFAGDNTFPISGNVGIGTTSPSALLDLYTQGGTGPVVELSNNIQVSSGTIGRLTWGNLVAEQARIEGYNVDADQGEFRFSVNAAGTFTEAMRIDDSGNVGIGTTSPDTKLHVEGNISLEGNNWIGDTETTGIMPAAGIMNYVADLVFNIDADSNEATRAFIISKDRSGSTGGTELMRIQESGNVGIGTTNAISKLTLGGAGAEAITLDTADGSDNGEIYLAAGGAAAATRGAYIDMTGNEYPTWGGIVRISAGNVGSGTISLNTGGSTRLRILNNGNVGIGTTSPQSKLAVNGTINAKEVKVTNTGWSDFVFEDNYELPSLNSVESYIKKNKHLPDIPSAKEVKEQGLAVSDMLAKQMQKIEEMTLYLIELKKENDRLKERVAVLEGSIKGTLK